jgi:hypothetical protein
MQPAVADGASNECGLEKALEKADVPAFGAVKFGLSPKS